MIPSIAIIGRDTGTTRNHPVSRPSVCGKTHSQSNPMRVAFRRHRELGHVRIRIGSQRAHVTFPKTGKLFDECNPAGKTFHPSVACHLRADTGALIAVLPADRLRFKFSRSLKASGGLSSLVKCFQQPTSGLSQSLKSFSSLLIHASKETHGAIEWNEKVFPNLTKVLVKVT